MATTAPTRTLPPIRRALSPENAYQLSPAETGGGAVLHLFEATHDAAVTLAPDEINQLRHDLAAMLTRASQVLSPSVSTPIGRHAVEAFRAAFAAMDKVPAAEGDEVYRAVLAHIRSERGYLLREVSP